MFSHGKPQPDANSVRGYPSKDKAFCSPKTQHGRQVIRVFSGLKLCTWGPHPKLKSQVESADNLVKYVRFDVRPFLSVLRLF